MKKIICLLGIMVMLFLSLVSYAVSEPTSLDKKTTWIGGEKGQLPQKVENMTLAEISEKAMEEAAISGRIVEYRTEDGFVYRAIPDYGKSKRRLVRGSLWREGKWLRTDRIEVYNRNFRLPTPYVHHFN